MVKHVWSTPKGDELIAYIARVSNPQNQDNPKIEGLIRYCANNKHWSIFEMANMCVEIKTSRAISAQLLRHKSFSFQEYSQRYAEVPTYVSVMARRQDVKNRQNSIEDMSDEDVSWFYEMQQDNWSRAMLLYREALARGIAKEQARFLLPIGAETTLYFNGTIRSFIHYITLRTDTSTQKEHRDIAIGIRDVFSEHYPITAKAMGWLSS